MTADKLIEIINWICFENDTDLEDAELVVSSTGLLYLKIDGKLNAIK